MTGKDLLKKEYPHVLTNFDSDLYLKKSKQKEHSVFNDFILKTTKFSGSEYCSELNDKFFYSKDYQQVGEKINVTENLGHVVMKDKFIDDFIQIINKSNKMKALGSLNPSVKDKLRNRFEEKKISEIKKLHGNLKLKQYQMWSFRNPGGTILSGIKHDELSCLLALDDIKSPKFLFEHKPPSSVNIYRPTAFDAGFMKYWKYGGFTNPIGKCKGRSGLEETVHDCIEVKYIVSIDIIPN